MNRQEPSDFENAIEDAVGFNFRSIRTIRDIILVPNKVFKAYADRDRITYTPALRIWLGLLSLSFVVLYFFGGYTEILKQAIDANPSSADILRQEAGDQYDAVIETMANTATTLQAPLLGLLTALSVFALRFFRKEMSFVARLNITFATLSTGTLVNIIITFSIIFGVIPIADWLAYILWPVYFLTFWRGSPGVIAETHTGALLKALGFSTIIITLFFIANILNMLISLIYALNSVGAT